MTEKVKEKIKELRLEAMGYKAIATILGISRDSIRGFCKRNGLEGNSSVVALNTIEKIKNNLLCACCEKPIKQKEKGKLRKFCSDNCRRKWWKEHQVERTHKQTAFYTYTCPHCNKEFKVYGNKNRKYCSHDCYIKARFGEAQTNNEWREIDGI